MILLLSFDPPLCQAPSTLCGIIRRDTSGSNGSMSNEYGEATSGALNGAIGTTAVVGNNPSPGCSQMYHMNLSYSDISSRDYESDDTLRHDIVSRGEIAGQSGTSLSGILGRRWEPIRADGGGNRRWIP